MSFTTWHVQQHSKHKKLFHKNAKPRTLLITRNFPPLVGGMERLNQHIFLELSRGFHMGLVGPRGAYSTLRRTRQVWECPVIPLPKFLFCASIKGIQSALRLRPRIILAGSGLTAPIAYIAGKIVGARVVVYLHGLDVEVRHPIYRCLWRPSFRRFNLVIVNSKFTKRLAENAGVSPQRIVIIHPGVSMPKLEQSTEKRWEFRQRHKLGHNPVMLYVGRITPRKGLASFSRDILPRVLKQLPSAKLVVIGDAPSLALIRRDDELRLVKHIFISNSLGKSVLFLGNVGDNELDAAYFAADVLIFPVQQHSYDNEGFGMVAIEGAAHGLPTVAFAAGGVPDAVRDGISGRLIPARHNQAFADAVLEVLSQRENNRWHMSCRKFAEEFSWAAFGHKLRRVCLEILSE